MLGAVAHEFFHVWNVERIRPQSLEPFDFTDANLSPALWLAEGFTNYYGKLVMMRSGLTTLGRTLDSFGATLDVVIASPGRRLNSAVDMSRLAPFTDAATAIDPTNFGNTFVSYYTWGEAIGLGLDLTLRGAHERSGHPGRLYACAVGAIRQARWVGARDGRPAVHPGRCPGRPGRGVWRRPVCRYVLRPVHRRSGCRELRRAPGPSRVGPAASRTPDWRRWDESVLVRGRRSRPQLRTAHRCTRQVSIETTCSPLWMATGWRRPVTSLASSGVSGQVIPWRLDS